MSRALRQSVRMDAHARRLHLRVRQHNIPGGFLEDAFADSVVFDVLAKHDPDTIDIAYGDLANSVGLICGS